MSWWSRVRETARRIVERFTEPTPEPTPPPAPEPREPREPRAPREPVREPREPREPEKESRLPPGWELVGLYHEGEKTQRIHATDDTDVTDGEIQHADALIVHFVDAGDDGYRWIHGATDWDSIADQINRTIIIVSPLGRGE